MDEKAPIRTAVITGTAGIALGVAKRLLRDGFSVVLCGNDLEQNERARFELTDQNAQVVALDVSDASAVEQFAIELQKSSRRGRRTRQLRSDPAVRHN